MRPKQKNIHRIKHTLAGIVFYLIPSLFFGQLSHSMSPNDLPSDPQHPMYGMNLYIPAFDEDFETNLNWYGSGDIDGNDTINMADYNSTVTSTDPFNDGNHRGDTDLDGDVDSSDKVIILDYINGNRTHINRWELESETEKISHLENALAIDPTSEIPAGSSGWICDQYTNQTFVNFSGVYDIANSVFGSDNGTNVQYDITHNGIFRIPLRSVATETGTGVTHAINMVYLGSPNNQDATEFDSRTYFEPQTDEIQEPGDYSLNDYADESWYGYADDPVWGWGYSNYNLVKYDLDVTPIVSNYENPDLVTSWTPFDQVEYPNDATHEFPGDTTVATNGEPEDLYTGTVFSHADTSTQTNDSTCTDFTYTVTRSWEGVAGAYDGTNIPLADHDQIINVEDTTPPVVTSFPNDTTMEYFVGINTDTTTMGVPTGISDNNGLEAIVSYSDVSTQTNDGTCSDVTYNISRNWSVSDVCGNETTHTQEIYVEDTTPPTYTIGENGPENVEDNSGLEVEVTQGYSSTQGDDPESCDYYSYSETTSHYMTDVCGNESSYDEEPVDVVNAAPYITSVPVPNNDTIFVPAGEEIHPDYTGWAEWADSEGGPVTKDYQDELLEEDGVHRLYHRTQTATDPCEMSPDSAYHYVYEEKSIGIPAYWIKEKTYCVFPNPNRGEFKLCFNKKADFKVSLYSDTGKFIEEKVYQSSTGRMTFTYSMQNKPDGLYVLKIESAGDSIETEIILKQD